MEALVLHFPLHVFAPGLLTHEAAAAAALDHLKRRQIGGVIVKSGEAAGLQQLEHGVVGVGADGMKRALSLIPAGTMAAGRLTD